LRISRQNSSAGDSLLPLTAAAAATAAVSTDVLDSFTAVVAPSAKSFLDFLVGFVTVSWLTLLADDVDDSDGLVTAGVGEESNGLSYGDVLMTDAPGVVVSAFLFTPFFVYTITSSKLFVSTACFTESGPGRKKAGVKAI